MILDKTEFSPGGFNQIKAIRSVHKRAFGNDIEPDLAEALLAAKDTTIDLCASVDGLIVGHGVLTELQGPQKALALAPLAVDPDWRDFQIGTELVRRLVKKARQIGWKSIFVLGDPDFYGRFGFRSELANCVDCEYQGNKFMALELIAGALTNYRGVLIYPQPFRQVNSA